MGKEDLGDELGGPVGFHSCRAPSPESLVLSGAFPILGSSLGPSLRMTHTLNDSLRALALPVRSPLGPGLGDCSERVATLSWRIQSGPESLVVGTEGGAPGTFLRSLKGGGGGDLRSEILVGEVPVREKRWPAVQALETLPWFQAERKGKFRVARGPFLLSCRFAS